MDRTDRATDRSAPWPWTADLGNGMFENPILHADYSDPDAIRVGDDYYMTASSFGHIPGLPILHSNDLVNWRLINHAIPRMPLPGYDRPQHGNGVWAPSLRYHDGMYWIFYGDPDVGIFMTKAADPAGEWSAIHLVEAGRGLIDPCPFWDDDGQAYLVHAYANSRSGIKHRLRVRRMSADGRRLLDEGVVVIDDPAQQPTIEGPKMYKRNGYYYIFAPAGGVEAGWQTVLRSRSPLGPYEHRIVLAQGRTPINGPHQGAWIELESGESWFMHFQHKGAYGRIVHLQPMTWTADEWPVIGEDEDGDGIGQPVLRAPKPDVGRNFPIEAPSASDGFDDGRLGLQWQWQANPDPAWYSLNARSGWLRLSALPADGSGEGLAALYDVPHLLLQKFPALAFQAAVRVDGAGLQAGGSAGLIVFGYHYAALVLGVDDHGRYELRLLEGDCDQAAVVWRRNLSGSEASMRVLVRPGAQCIFQFSLDGQQYETVPHAPFEASVSKWVGAKVGLFALGVPAAAGCADFDDFTVTALEE